jgi:hypothetical protein
LSGRGLGGSTARWLASASLGIEHQQRWPESYRVVRYEDLVSNPLETLRRICEFLGEDFFPEMVEMRAEPRFDRRGEREDGVPSPLSPAFIGRFRESLTPFEIYFIQKRAGRWMQDYGYQPVPVRFNRLGAGFDWLFSSVSLLGWLLAERTVRVR